MKLVSFSIRTKGAHHLARRFGTICTRFGASENPRRRALPHADGFPSTRRGSADLLYPGSRVSSSCYTYRGVKKSGEGAPVNKN